MGKKYKQNNDVENFDLSLEPFVIEKESFRPAKVASRIKEELLFLVPDSIKDPRMDKLKGVVITDVICSQDLRNARVLFGMAPESENRHKLAETILNAAARYLRSEVSQNLGIKYTPLFSFHFDKGMAHTQKINTLLHQVHDLPAVETETLPESETDPLDGQPSKNHLTLA
jgi:ribosome-binding factor A